MTEAGWDESPKTPAPGPPSSPPSSPPLGPAPWNTFVEGDNLDVLAALPGASVDLVYLDPPYNTGSRFAYLDDASRADRADRAAGSDVEDGPPLGRHGAWLAMMRPRLEQVRRVLAPGGATYVSIDDHEVAHLRLLLDEVFGEENFLGQLVVSLNPKGRQLGRGFALSHEYLLVYARDRRTCVLDPATEESVDPADFAHVLPDGRRYRLLPLRNTNKKFNPATTPTLHYPVWGDPVTGAVRTEPFDGAQELRPVFGDGAPAVWRWSAPLLASRPDDVVCRVVRGRLGERIDVYQRDWLHEGRRKKLRTVWTSQEVGSTDAAVAELKALVGHLFESPKPTGLLRRILATMPPDARVLDPFAGSGTTGHAVALANVADGGTRTCLSIERGDVVRPGSRAAQAAASGESDVETVADVTRARLRAVARVVGGGFAEL